MVKQTQFQPDSIPSPPRERRQSGSGVAAGPLRHSVVRGDTFATIAQRYYGSARYDRALWWFNRGTIAVPERLAVGGLVIIPAVEELDPSKIRRMGSSAGPEGSSPRGALPVHVVRSYETLRSIARDRLGNALRADEIIDLNRDRIPDLNRLAPGQRLLLPEDAMPAATR